MGKTTIARVLLHHTEITTRYEQHRYFVPCDAAKTKVELAALVGAHLGLEPERDLARAIVWHLSSSPPSLLVLDNLETVWEPLEFRTEVEEFLSLLTDVKHLALMITMRGTQRPAKVAWSHPFPPPLDPLGQDAAHQTFIDIADVGHNTEDIDKVLALTDNMPLAISLLAHLVDIEGCSTVLSRWEQERTSMICDGWDRRSNLDASISMSLSSPRLAAFPHSQDLLSLLSVLPNGISDAELVQSKLPIGNILGCKSVLVGTSLAYSDTDKRMKVLVPIREYMQKILPPTDDLIRPLRTYFQQLLELSRKYHGTSSTSSPVARILLNLANIEHILQHGFSRDHPDIVDFIYCTCYLNQLSRLTHRGEIHLMKQIPSVFPLPCDHRLEAYFATTLLDSWYHTHIGDVDTVISQALTHVKLCDDPDLKCSFYISLASTYRRKQEHSVALSFVQIASSLAISNGNIRKHSQALGEMAWANWELGHYPVAQTYAQESRRLARLSTDLYLEAQALHLEATCWYSLGDYQQTLSLCNLARDLLAFCGMSYSQHGIICTQAEVHKQKSEYTAAQKGYQHVLQETSGDPWDHAFAILNIAELDVLMDVPNSAVQHDINMAKDGFKTLGYIVGCVMCDTLLADLALREGDMLVARALFLECLHWAWGKNAEIVSRCLRCLGDASRWPASAETSNWAIVLLAHPLKLKERIVTHKALLSLGHICYSQADKDTAMSLFNVALEGFTQMDVHRSRAECMLHLGDIFKGHGDSLKAVELWDTARPLFERSSQGKQVSKIEQRLASIGDELLEQHRKSLAHLAELRAPTAIIEEEEEELSDIEDFQEVDDENNGSVLVA
ncbi:hypothetical protein C8R47DRAFT_1240871 [Mycena vitilis]|nr:hypothetical protein C8R47DRAFT_1240871 [Mycena vitilis]